jgi:hypothetical protein
VPAHAAYGSRLLPLLALFGQGGGLTLPSVTSLGMSGATDADSGVLSGVFNTAQQVGGAVGLTVLTTLAASRTGTAQTPQALTSGYHLAWLAGAILAGVSVAVAAITLRQPGGPDRHLSDPSDGAAYLSTMKDRKPLSASRLIASFARAKSARTP